jgi:hypothetical protein
VPSVIQEYAVEAGRDFRVARSVGVEGEMELAYAAVQQLCSPSLELIERLPDPQRDALAVALGLSSGQAPNPFLVGLAVLGLLSEAAEDRPLLCLVDDAQWLDRASARVFAFVARRLLAERIALVFAARALDDALAGVAELRVAPLGQRDSRALLESVLPGRLDERVLERIIAETRGNPLALLELPRGLTPAQLAGGFGLPAALPLSAAIEESFTGSMSAATSTAPLRKRPIQRTTRTAAPGTGRRPPLCPTRTSPRSWSARRPSAGARRCCRGRSFLDRSSVLTPDPSRRAGRALAAAEAKQQAGALEEALTLVASADTDSLDGFQRARVDVLRARISFAMDRGSEAPSLLLAAAKRLEPLDGRLAREIYLDALNAALFAGRLGGEADARQVAAAARAAPRPATTPGAPDLLLDGLAVLITDGHAAGTPIVRKALSAFHADGSGTEESLRWLWLAGRAAGFIWDYEVGFADQAPDSHCP